MSVLDRIRQAGSDFYRRMVDGNAVARPIRLNEKSDAELRELMLAGTIYDPASAGGGLKYVYKALGRPCANEGENPIIGYFNPVHPICNFSTNAFGGTLGSELKLVDPKGKPLAAAVEAAIGKIWAWSNLNTRSAELAVENANQGAVGCRIVFEPGPPPRIYLDLDSRKIIKRVDFDGRRNVRTVWLTYTIQGTNEDGTPGETINVEETISKFGFSLLYDGVEQLSADEQLNPMGVCPYVVFNYEMRVGHDLGVHAYFGSERAIHGINWSLSQLDESTRAHLWPYIFSSSPAKAPSKLKLGKTTLLHSQTREGMPQPTFDAQVPKVNYADIVAYVVQAADWLRERQPQLVLNSLKLIGGVSGETLQQLLIPAQSESMRVRRMIEDTMVRAIQIALSVGIYHRAFELGTSNGTKEAADRAYGDGGGVMAFKFADRPALPPTVAQKIQNATADQSEMAAKAGLAASLQKLGLPMDEVWGTLGYDATKIAALKAKRAAQSTLETEGGESDFDA